MTTNGVGIGRCLAHGLVMTTVMVGLVASTILPAWAAVVPRRPQREAPSTTASVLPAATASLEGAPSLDTQPSPASAPQPSPASETQPSPASAPRPAFDPEVERWRELSSASAVTVQRATGVALDEDLLLALVAVESGGRPNARSEAGAVGLTQVEPATYADLQARYATLLANRSLAQPATNMLAGGLYLAECARVLHVDVANPAMLELVLDAYNVGPRATAEWWHGGRPEPLPDETIQHATRIMAAYASVRD